MHYLTEEEDEDLEETEEDDSEETEEDEDTDEVWKVGEGTSLEDVMAWGGFIA